jgi:hypothetical protein
MLSEHQAGNYDFVGLIILLPAMLDSGPHFDTRVVTECAEVYHAFCPVIFPAAALRLSHPPDLKRTLEGENRSERITTGRKSDSSQFCRPL